MVTPPPPAPWRIALAVGTVWLVWGSTYVAMGVVVRDMPVFLMASARFFMAGALMTGAGLLSRQPVPSGREMGNAAVLGWFWMLAGNGAVCWAVQYIASGLAALLVASLPLWTLFLEMLTPDGARPNRLGVAGIVVGFLGVVTLVFPSLQAGAPSALWAEAVVLVGTVIWAVGSLLGRRLALPASGLYQSGLGLWSAAAGFGALAILRGEPAAFDWTTVGPQAWLAFAYLIGIGSCVGFYAFAWCVRNVRPDLASTYAYVNPVVAMALGALVLGEPLTGWTLAGAALVVGAVALVIRSRQAA